VSPWALAARNVRRNGRRSLLTGGVVAFGFAAFAMAGGFMAQTFEALRDGTIHGGTGHLQIADADEFDAAAAGPLEHPVADADRVAGIVASDPDVLAVLPRIEFMGLVTNGERSIPYLGTGLDPGPEARSMEPPKSVETGHWLTGRKEHAVVLGTGLARALGVGPGDTVTVMATTPEGVLNAVDAIVDGLVVMPFKDLDDRYLVTSLDLASELLATSGKVSKIVVVLRDGAVPEAALARILGRLRAEGIELAGRTWEQLDLFYGQVRLLYVGIFGFMGIVLVTVVLLAAANTMAMAAAERTREIGTLRALGTRPGTVMSVFIAEGVLIGLIGSAAGMALALVIRLVLNHSGIMLPPPPGVTQGAALHIRIYFFPYLGAAVAMTTTLVLASLLPARRAARMKIIDALAHV
jgi:putative ABC transport system permease protein